MLAQHHFSQQHKREQVINQISSQLRFSVSPESADLKNTNNEKLYQIRLTSNLINHQDDLFEPAKYICS